MDERFEPGNGSGLLEETRQALSALRAEDLEKLAARAEAAFDANPHIEPPKQGGPDLYGADVAKLTRERRLLGDLMLATDRNLAVLQRLRHSAGDWPQAEGVDPRWVTLTCNLPQSVAKRAPGKSGGDRHCLE